MPESRRRRRRGRPIPRTRGGANLTTYGQRPRQRSGRRWLYVTASAIIAVLVIAGFVVPSLVGLGGGAGQTVGSSYEYVSGVGQQHDIMVTRQHVPESASVEYNSVPATSGDHWAQWSECGFFEQELPDERVVHNLEHGNIVVSYNLATPEEVEQLRGVFEDIGLSNVHGIARRYTKIPEGSVVLTAWGSPTRWTALTRNESKISSRPMPGPWGPNSPMARPAPPVGSCRDRAANAATNGATFVFS